MTAEEPPTTRGAEIRFTLACVAGLLALVGVVGLASGWTVTCPETHATGWMDCSGQEDAEWRSDGLPNWVTPGMLLAALATGTLVLAGTFAAHHRERIHRRRAQKQRTARAPRRRT